MLPTVDGVETFIERTLDPAPGSNGPAMDAIAAAGRAGGRLVESIIDPAPGSDGPVIDALHSFVDRTSDAWAQHQAGDDRALDDVIADTVTAGWLVGASVMTGRIAAPVLATDLLAADAEAADLVFYSVQSEADAARLAAGGAPWPTAPTRAALGEGFYAWSTREQAEAYLARLSARGVENLTIIEASISPSAYEGLATLDLRTLTEAAQEAFYEQFHGTLSHGFEHLIRQTGNSGAEYFFSRDVFSLFTVH